MQKILLATRNRKKCAELQALLSDVERGLDILTVDDVSSALPEVVEDGDTFEANAKKKAVVLAQASGYMTLADDSGLCVDALDGAPGVRSARFAGENADDAANNALLIQRLQSVTDRAAHFVCVLALALPNGECQTVSGACHGTLLRAPRGASGFGYDPLFVPNGYTCTFAEMESAEKQRISHRAKALLAAREKWVVDGCFRML